jgi:signal transduction histidine kinase
MNENLTRLSTLIVERRNQIIDQWKTAAYRLPRAENLDELLLLDHMPQMLNELSSALTEAESLSILEMRAHKSAVEHGVIRFQLGFDVEEVIAEFGLLRDVLQQFAEACGVNISGGVNLTVNRVIDKAIAVSLQTYVRQQAEEVKRKRKEYLSFVVHDLKTPISAMATATYIIDQNLGVDTTVAKKMIDILRRNAAHLNNRVLEIINEENRLQALSGDQSSLQLELRELDLWPIAERLKQDCQSIADSRHDRIRNDVPHDLRIFGDPDLLLEAFQNLLSNALKYTAHGEITIGATEDEDSTVCWFADTGVGIPPERIDRIFQKGTSDPKMAESTGLGLAIVEKVMQLHRGTVSVESAPGAGSTFRLQFPKRQSNAA